MIDKAELGALFEGLRASVTIADQDFQITFMNDRAFRERIQRVVSVIVGSKKDGE